MSNIEIKVPVVGESITEVTIAQWLKKDGDQVKMDEVLCELESDKATFELNAEADGILKTNAQEGDTLQIGDIICYIDTNQKGDGKVNKATVDNKTAPVSEGGTNGPQKTGRTIEMQIPTVGESITEVTISSLLKKDGDFVKLDEVIAEIESDKATFELTAEAEGYLEIHAKEGDTLAIGDLICKIIETKGGQLNVAPVSDSVQGQVPQPSEGKSYASGHPSPAAAKILAEKGIAASGAQGTGVGGRITKEDALNSQKPAPSTVPTPSKPTPPTVTYNDEREENRKRMSQLRKTISKRLVAAKNETAMLTTFNEVDMKPIMDIRKKYKDLFKEKHDVGLGFMSFFTKAACVALQEWPSVNAKIDGDETIQHNYCDISVAVSTERGLVVPVIRNAEKLSFDAIEKKIVELAVKARDNKLSIEEMTGGTFTITNGGIFGSMLSTPIINAPQSAILGMHNIVERPVVANGEIVVRPIMYIALSYDHRIIDGRESVSFLVRIKQLLEDPTRLLLGV